MVMFLMVKLSHLDLSTRFDVCCIFTINFLFQWYATFTSITRHYLTDFVNLKIKSVQSFGDARMSFLFQW
jgi:hypothetical protein